MIGYVSAVDLVYIELENCLCGTHVWARYRAVVYAGGRRAIHCGRKQFARVEPSTIWLPVRSCKHEKPVQGDPALLETGPVEGPALDLKRARRRRGRRL